MEKIYKQMRNAFLPKKIKVIFILESPPVSGHYFYNPGGRPTEILFREMMNSLFGEKFHSKNDGLKKFMGAGYFLVDPIYKPVNKLKKRERDSLILNNYKNFLRDLKNLIGHHKVSLIIIKKSVHRLLSEKLKNDGFNLLNLSEEIPFPMPYHRKEFDSKIKLCLSKIN